jgi:hypothetical protein
MDKSIAAYEIWAKYINESVSKMPMYEVLVFHRGTANYHQKKFKLAGKDFQYLVDTYPENDKYRNWLLGARTYNIKKYGNYIWGLAFGSLIMYSLATKDGDENRKYFLIAGVVFTLVGSALYLIDLLAKAVIVKK